MSGDRINEEEIGRDVNGDKLQLDEVRSLRVHVGVQLGGEPYPQDVEVIPLEEIIQG